MRTCRQIGRAALFTVTTSGNKPNVHQLINGMLFDNEKERSSDIFYSNDESYTNSKKPDTKDHMVHDSIYIRSKNYLYSSLGCVFIICELYLNKAV